jgi:hypothetical protein
MVTAPGVFANNAFRAIGDLGDRPVYKMGVC